MKIFTNEFNEVAGVKVYDTLPDSVRMFRASLVDEEYKELLDGIKNDDRIEQLDAIADLIVVAGGWLYVKNYGAEYDLKEYEYSTVACLDMICDTVAGIRSEDDLINIIYALGRSLDFSNEVINNALVEVHRSNMSKFCENMEDSIKSQNEYYKKNIKTFIGKNEDKNKYVISRLHDSKILKGIHYTPPKLCLN